MDSRVERVHDGGGGRSLLSSDPEGEKFVQLCLWWVGVSIAIILAVTAISYIQYQKRKRAQPDLPISVQGIFASAHWPTALRGTVGLAMVVLFLLPTCILAVCCAVGVLLAGLEGWSFFLGVEYVMSNVLGLQHPITEVTPTSLPGQFSDVIVSLWALLLVTTFMGLASGMCLISDIAEMMPPSTAGFCRYLFLYIPLFLMLLAVVTGALLAGIEGWPFSDGFFFMAGAIAGLAEPLVDKAPVQAMGLFVEAFCISAELTVGGAVIGITGSHPLIQKVITFLEGQHHVPEETEATPAATEEKGVSPTPEEACSRDYVQSLEARVEDLQAELARLRKTLEVEARAPKVAGLEPTSVRVTDEAIESVHM